MTHNDIYTKFMIEYDKANVTSSYPSLTEYEVATILDKAYNALIAQKVTGNNYRRAPFESDIKAISDLQPLITEKKELWNGTSADGVIKNQKTFSLQKDFLYYVSSYLERDTSSSTKWHKTVRAVATASEYIFPEGIIPPSYVFEIDTHNVDTENNKFEFSKNISSYNIGRIASDNSIKNINSINVNPSALSNSSASSIDKLFGYFNNEAKFIVWYNDIGENDVLYWSKLAIPIDSITTRSIPCQIVDSNTASRFFSSAYNIPWIKNPVCYIHTGKISVVHDPYSDNSNNIRSYTYNYIKTPYWFVKKLTPSTENVSFFTTTGDATNKKYGCAEFELNDTMAEELISLAIIYALENIESPRLNTKLNTRGLEA